MDIEKILSLVFGISVTSLIGYFLYKQGKLEEQNKINDITNKMLDIELKKKELDEKFAKMSLEDLVNNRNAKKSSSNSSDNGSDPKEG